MRWFLILPMVVLMFAVLSSPATAQTTCSGGQCTTLVGVTAEVRQVIVQKTVATVRRSVGVAVKVAVAPAKIVVKIAERKPVRTRVENLLERKPARKALAAIGRLLCFRR